MCGAFHEGGAVEADQAWVLQSAGRTSGICAGLSLATSAGERTEWSRDPGSLALVDHT